MSPPLDWFRRRDHKRWRQTLSRSRKEWWRRFTGSVRRLSIILPAVLSATVAPSLQLLLFLVLLPGLLRVPWKSSSIIWSNWSSRVTEVCSHVSVDKVASGLEKQHWHSQASGYWSFQSRKALISWIFKGICKTVGSSCTKRITGCTARE